MDLFIEIDNLETFCICGATLCDSVVQLHDNNVEMNIWEHQIELQTLVVQGQV